MALDTLEVFGTEYTNVAGFKATDDNNQTKTYIRPQGTKSISANGTGIDVTAYASVDVNVSGGGGTSTKQVNFIDYDGTILHSYSKAEINAMTQESDLPANPSHTGLTAQGWNWTLAQIKAQLTAIPDGPVWVGQMYVTTSGDTEIDCVFSDAARLSPILTIAVNGTVSVDWGDNTTPDTVTGDSLTNRQGPQHTYASPGSYTIKISVVSGSFSFYGSSNYSLLRKSTSANQNRVYSNCVQAIRIGTGITSFGNTYAFHNCYSLTSITIPNTITSIGTYAFNHCYSLTSITIPSGVTSINTSDFYYCYSLNNISIPSTVTSTGDYVFYGCYSLTSITIPSNITSIGSYIFSNCCSLVSITIPSNVTSIAAYAFEYCRSIVSITIPSGVTSIAEGAFHYCSSLNSIIIPNTITSIGAYAFEYCGSLASITIPSNVTSIGSTAFYNCYSLNKITIPNGVTSIGTYLFYGCYSLASITIPNGVTSIENYAFSNCYGVAEYHVLPTTPPTLGTSIFTGIPSDCVIYVPSASLADYQSASGWSDYASYMQGE